MLIVDIRHWLDDRGGIPTDNLRLRRRALRIARLIEYGGPLDRGESRETLVECARRPGGRPCLGLIWVEKTENDAIHAFCVACRCGEALITGWQATEWADGMMEPVPEDLGASPPARDLN
jgi:hypothetical protein